MKLNEHINFFSRKFCYNFFHIGNWKVAHHLPSVNVIAGEMVQRLQALRDTRWDLRILQKENQIMHDK